MLYRYGLSIGIQLLRRGELRESLRYLVIPVNYWRALEYQLIYRACRFRRSDRVLDIGSPKLLAAYLAEHLGLDMTTTDIDPYFVSTMETIRAFRRIPSARFHTRVEDGRALTFADNQFSKIYSISVIEHIPDTGDVACAREIGRVLAPGGICAITVPFAPVYRDEYRGPDFYWAKWSVTNECGQVFYQRRYSEQALFERIIEPSGLSLVDLRYVGEKVMQDSPKELADVLPRVTGPVQPLLSRVLHTKPVRSWQQLRKPLCALIVLRKHDANPEPMRYDSQP